MSPLSAYCLSYKTPAVPPHGHTQKLGTLWSQATSAGDKVAPVGPLEIMCMAHRHVDAPWHLLRCSRAIQNRNLTTSTKAAVHRAVCLSTLLNGSKTWTPYQRHIHTLEAIHIHCLRSILGVSWEDRSPYIDIYCMTGPTHLASSFSLGKNTYARSGMRSVCLSFASCGKSSMASFQLVRDLPGV